MTTQTNFEITASKFVVVPGRIQQWRDHPEKKTLNHSCTTKVASDLFEDMEYVSTALRGAAGINLVINNFKRREPTKVQWHFYLPASHPDFKKILPEQERFRVSRLRPNSIKVADSMSDAVNSSFSIEESWFEFYLRLAFFMPCIVDLSNLRCEGTTNSLGLVASGPLSFLKIYKAIADYVEQGNLTTYLKIFSTLNEVLRRGGFYKNGGISTSLDYEHEDVAEYINLPLSETPYLKKGLRVTPAVKDNPQLVDDIIESVNKGVIWLEKYLGLHEGEELHSNLCRGISLKDRGTCLLSHVNAGMITQPKEWITAWRDAMQFACSVFELQAVKKVGIYRDPSSDRQVGVGVTGLANFLSFHGIKYKIFVEAFENLLAGFYDNTIASEMVWNIFCGVQDAADIARSHNLRAAFTIEPCASCSYRYKDLKGFTLAPNIDAPVAIPGIGLVRRNSEAVGDKYYEHGPVETAKEVGASLHYRHRVCWQRLFDHTGLAHMSSYDLQEPWTKEKFNQWMDGPLKTTYYRRNIEVTSLRKGQKIQTAKTTFCTTENETCEACGD